MSVTLSPYLANNAPSSQCAMMDSRSRCKVLASRSRYSLSCLLIQCLLPVSGPDDPVLFSCAMRHAPVRSRGIAVQSPPGTARSLGGISPATTPIPCGPHRFAARPLKSEATEDVSADLATDASTFFPGQDLEAAGEVTPGMDG